MPLNLPGINRLQDAETAIYKAIELRPAAANYHFTLTVIQIQRGRCALKTLIEKYANGWAYQIAEVYALRDDAKATFEWLNRAWSNRDPGLTNLLFDPFIAR